MIISNFKWGQSTYTFQFADGAVAAVNKDTWELEFSKLPDITEEETTEIIPETEDIEQMNAELLETLYSDDAVTSDFFNETEDTIIPDVTESTSVTDENDEIADMTDIQAMILAENMSAFSDDSQVYDGVNLDDMTEDSAMLSQLLVSSSVQ